MDRADACPWLLTHHGRTGTVAEWAWYCRITTSTLRLRYQQGKRGDALFRVRAKPRAPVAKATPIPRGKRIFAPLPPVPGAAVFTSDRWAQLLGIPVSAMSTTAD